MRWVVLVACAGCWSSSEPTTDRAVEPAPKSDRVIEQAPKRPAHSVWRGHYVCAQGQTALTLSMEHTGPTLAATFDFGPLDVNPTVPHGTYSMTGEATTPGDGSVHVVLRPKEWIDHPQNYVMVGIDATTDPERRTLRGRITNATCGEVELSRTE